MLKKITITGTPAFASVEPTTSCNLQCPECPSGLKNFKRAKGQIDYIDYCNFIDNLSPELFWLNLYFQGEPFLSSNFVKMVKYAREKRIYTATSTNGHFLNDDNCKAIINAGLDRIIISLDGIDQKTYEQYRKGGEVAKVLAGIKRLTTLKKQMKSRKPYIIIQSLLFKSNEDQIDKLKSWWKESAADELQFKKAQFYDFEQGKPLMPEQNKNSRYEKSNDGVYRLKNRLSDHCKRMWFSVVITWDGNVVPCCFDKDAEYIYGNLKDEKIKAIWQGKKSLEFRKILFSNRKSIEICRNCDQGS